MKYRERALARVGCLITHRSYLNATLGLFGSRDRLCGVRCLVVQSLSLARAEWASTITLSKTSDGGREGESSQMEELG